MTAYSRLSGAIAGHNRRAMRGARAVRRWPSRLVEPRCLWLAGLRASQGAPHSPAQLRALGGSGVLTADPLLRCCAESASGRS